MITDEIFRQAQKHLEDYLKTDEFQNFLEKSAYTLEIERFSNKTNLSTKHYIEGEYNDILGLRVRIYYKQYEFVFGLVSDVNPSHSAIAFLVQTGVKTEEEEKKNLSYHKNNPTLSAYTTVYQTSAKLQNGADLNTEEQYKLLLKLFFANVNVDVFKLGQVFKEEGVEPRVHKVLQEFVRLTNTYMVKRSGETILPTAQYIKLMVKSYIEKI